MKVDIGAVLEEFNRIPEENFSNGKLFKYIRDSVKGDDSALEQYLKIGYIVAESRVGMSKEDFYSRWETFCKNVPEEKAVEPEKPKKVPLTIERLSDELQSQGYYIRMNVLTHEVEVSSEYDDEIDFSGMVTIMHSWLRGTKPFYTGVTFDNLSAYALEIAKMRKYNPVLDYLNDIPWDGVDRTEELYSLMGITDDLSKRLIWSWFLQGIALLHNTEKKRIPAEGVLVLVGKQGCGKTSLIERFAIRPEWFVRGAAINSNDKDTFRRACSGWIIELGEVETTFKSDIDMLKNFITSDFDVYRVPYGRSDVKYARRSNLAATCNSNRYLIDQTGNRRWWTIPIEKNIKYEDIQRFDVVQLWREALAAYKAAGPGCFRLSSAEYDQLQERNNKALKPVKAEDEIADILESAKLHQRDFKYLDITITDWRGYFSSLKKYDTHTIGIALKKLGIEQARKKSDGRVTRLYNLPVWKTVPSSYDTESEAV